MYKTAGDNPEVFSFYLIFYIVITTSEMPEINDFSTHQNSQQQNTK